MKILDRFSDYKIQNQLDETTHPCKTALLAVADGALTPIHLAIRVRVLGALFLTHVALFRWDKAASDVLNIVETVLYDATLCATSVIALITAPWTNRVSQFNGELNDYFSKNPLSMKELKETIHDWSSEKVKLQMSDITPRWQTTYLSLTDVAFTPLHFVFRVHIVAIFLLANLLMGQLAKAKANGIDILKTALYDVALCITGLASLIVSPCTNRINKFNGTLNNYFIENPTPSGLMKEIKDWTSKKFTWCCK